MVRLKCFPLLPLQHDILLMSWLEDFLAWFDRSCENLFLGWENIIYKDYGSHMKLHRTCISYQNKRATIVGTFEKDEEIVT